MEITTKALKEWKKAARSVYADNGEILLQDLMTDELKEITEYLLDEYYITSNRNTHVVFIPWSVNKYNPEKTIDKLIKIYEDKENPKSTDESIAEMNRRLDTIETMLKMIYERIK